MNNAASDEHVTVQRLVRLFLKGLATIIPIALTLLIVLWLAGLAEDGVGFLIKLILPESWYIRAWGWSAASRWSWRSACSARSGCSAN